VEWCGAVPSSACSSRLCILDGQFSFWLSAVEEGIVLCKKLRLPSDHEIICSFESMQTELTSMLDAAAKEKEEAKAAE
jgi:hypothetical protein